jgi:hypothetical protein
LIEVPEGPWQKVGADIFTLNSKDYLIIVDYFSLYIEVSLLSSTNSKAIINAMKAAFSRHGTPLGLFTDNAANLVSEEMQRFAGEWDFVHETSSPYHAQSNGQSENAVKTIKGLIKKAVHSSEDVNRSLQIYRSTPLLTGKSPAELLMSRKIRSNLPMKKTLLHPELVNSTEIIEKKQIKKSKQKEYFDQRARALPELKESDKVRVKGPQDKQWSKQGTILKKKGRSYTIKMDNGGITRRNRRHIRHVDSSQSDIDGETPANEKPPPPELPQQGEKPSEQPQQQQSLPDNRKQPPDQSKTTRAGRTVKRPDYLKDFVTP